MAKRKTKKETRGRPTMFGDEPMVVTGLALPRSAIERIELECAKDGSTSRSDWMRAALLRSLRARGYRQPE